MKITPDVFAAYLKCQTKCWLRSHGEVGSGNTYAEWVLTRSDTYRGEATKLLMKGMPEAELVVASPAAEGLKAAQWRLAFDLLIQCGDMETRLHAVQRVPCEAQGQPNQLIPIRFIFFHRLTKNDRLLLAYDAFVLSEVLDQEVTVGQIIHADNCAVLTVKIQALQGEVRKLIAEIASLLSNNSAPDLILNRHCGECEFQAECKQKAVEKDDLSLLSGMTEKERSKLHGKGIFTINQLSFTFRPRKPPKRAKNPSNPRHYSLQAQAIREKTVYIHGKPEIPTSEHCLYFDVEGVPWRESYYLIGVLVVEADSAQYHAFWADDDDQTAMIEEFCQFVDSYHCAPLLHYGHYDVKALREMGRLIPEVKRNALGKLLSTTFNVLPVVHSHIYFPFHSIRLRKAASFLDYKFASGIDSGIESIVFREKWRSSGDENLKNELIAYNREDCEALRTVCDFIRQSVTLAEARDRVPGRQENIALSDCLRRAGEGNRPVFKKAEFVLPEFEKANRCAYFDYQRERVYARTKRKTVARNHPLSHTIRRPSQDTEVVVECRICSHCGSSRLSPRTSVRRRLIDLKFFKTGIGVKRWQPNYIIHQYRCRSCGAHLIPPGVINLDSKTIYGHNLMCWCVYQNVICKQALLQVERSLGEIFGLRLPHSQVYRFRSAIANYYRPLRDEILTAILNEDVINIDETPVNLRKTTGYVWVLATHNRVYYVYKESREGAFLQDLLAGFSGVLVSDFFTAYDSLRCLHQKCLVHLMRDINDDLRRYPFDEELRCMAQEFGAFLVNAVSTIDRWGLRSHHLRRHIKDADRLLHQIHRKSFASQRAVKYKNRFEKYADSLFTFLRHDSVPWNNNNAEHAVHYFAKVRRFTDGTFTSSSLEEILTLVTVLQTCEYSGVNPLQFLLSGETSLASITKWKPKPSGG